MLEFLLKYLNPQLLPWVFALNLIGYWLKKVEKPSWFPPMPLLLCLCSFVICALFGWVHLDPSIEGAKACLLIIGEYGIANGLFVCVCSVFLYDTVHAIVKNAHNKVATEEVTE